MGTSSDAVTPLLEIISVIIEVAGVGVIILGALVAAVLLIRDRWEKGSWEGAYHRYRANLGRGILLGLEFLVAADIIGTVAVTPSFENLGVLAGIVLIRTFLSFSLELEISGRWPWQERPKDVAPSEGHRATDKRV